MRPYLADNDATFAASVNAVSSLPLALPHNTIAIDIHKSMTPN
jgi:hypothetical protein